ADRQRERAGGRGDRRRGSERSLSGSSWRMAGGDRGIRQPSRRCLPGDPLRPRAVWSALRRASQAAGSDVIEPMALIGLLSLPVIVTFYMLRLRRRDVPVGSTFLWQQLIRDVEANAPWQRLRFSWLLLIQLLI